jgi:hypothetical protein
MDSATKQETWQERRTRIEKAMLEMKLTLEEFAAKCTVSFDDRFRRYEWRVRGDETLGEWIFDVYRDRTLPKYTDDEAIKIAFKRFCDLQNRNGQLNWHSVYVKGVEKVHAVAPKPGGNVAVNTAQIAIVQDSIDKIWRFGFDYFAVNGGCSCGAWFEERKAHTREAAILKGAEYIHKSVTSSWEHNEKKDAYKTFVNKLESFIEEIQSAIRQPSLFD